MKPCALPTSCQKHHSTAHCAKITIIVINVLICIGGLSACIVAANKARENDKLVSLSITGFITFIVGTIGLLGAIYEHVCLLATYVAILAFNMAVTLSLAIWLLVISKEPNAVASAALTMAIFVLDVVMVSFVYVLVKAIKNESNIKKEMEKTTETKSTDWRVGCGTQCADAPKPAEMKKDGTWKIGAGTEYGAKSNDETKKSDVPWEMGCGTECEIRKKPIDPTKMAPWKFGCGTDCGNKTVEGK